MTKSQVTSHKSQETRDKRQERAQWIWVDEPQLLLAFSTYTGSSSDLLARCKVSSSSYPNLSGPLALINDLLSPPTFRFCFQSWTSIASHRKRMSITEAIQTIYAEKVYRKPLLTSNASKKALEDSSWADVCFVQSVVSTTRRLPNPRAFEGFQRFLS